MGQSNSTQSAVAPTPQPGAAASPKMPRMYKFISDHPCGFTRCTVCNLTTYDTPCTLCGLRVTRAVCNGKCRHVYCFECMEDFLQYESRPLGAWTHATRLTCRCPDQTCKVEFDRLIHCWYGREPGEELPVEEMMLLQIRALLNPTPDTRFLTRGQFFTNDPAVPTMSPSDQPIANPKIPRMAKFIGHHECAFARCTTCIPTTPAQRCTLCGMRVTKGVCNEKCRHVYCYDCMEDFLSYESRPLGAWTLETRLTCRCPDQTCKVEFDRLIHCWGWAVDPDDEDDDSPAPVERRTAQMGEKKFCAQM